jgi:hypothetical protein
LTASSVGDHCLKSQAERCPQIMGAFNGVRLAASTKEAALNYSAAIAASCNLAE